MINDTRQIKTVISNIPCATQPADSIASDIWRKHTLGCLLKRAALEGPPINRMSVSSHLFLYAKNCQSSPWPECKGKDSI